MTFSVIISIYKNLKGLELILYALDKQTFQDFEVVISEDNNAPETIAFLEKMRNQLKFTIKHVSQEDTGFRKTRILNKALLAADAERLVFLDGDCVPHKQLLKEYYKELTVSNITIGRRCYLNHKITNELLETKNFGKLSFFNLLFNAKRLKHAFYIPFLKKDESSRRIIGCNWAVYKQNLLDINGYDEDYNRAGRGEDFDIDWRLRKKGLTVSNIKHKVITYHLHHPCNHNDDDANAMEELMQQKIKEGNIRCKNGITSQ